MGKKKVKKDAYKHSILTDDLEHCIFCGREPVQFHHIFGGPYRNTATEMDMIVPLCWECHMKLHTDPNQRERYRLMRDAQWMYEADHTREEFMQIFGKSYL